MIIEKIEIKDKIVKVVTDEETFEISIETYLNNRFLIGEEISKEEVEIIFKKDKVQLIRNEILVKLARKKLSKIECKEFLLERGLDNKSVNEIIDSLEKNYLINDQELLEFIIDYYLMKRKGINYIKEKAKERKIYVSDEFYHAYIDKNQYQKNILSLINKYTKMGKNKSSLQLKQFIINKLIENGYDYNQFIKFVDIEDIDEKSILVKEITKFFKSREVNFQNIAKITKKLLSKGFSYVIIKEVIRSVNENEVN